MSLRALRFLALEDLRAIRAFQGTRVGLTYPASGKVGKL